DQHRRRVLAGCDLLSRPAKRKFRPPACDAGESSPSSPRGLTRRKGPFFVHLFARKGRDTKNQRIEDSKFWDAKGVRFLDSWVLRVSLSWRMTPSQRRLRRIWIGQVDPPASPPGDRAFGARGLSTCPSTEGTS